MKCIPYTEHYKITYEIHLISENSIVLRIKIYKIPINSSEQRNIENQYFQVPDSKIIYALFGLRVGKSSSILPI